jgi:hypothetical protein
VEVLQGPGRRNNRFRIRDLFTDERCSQAILDVLSTTDVGRRVSQDRAIGEAQSEASESELREREVRKEEKRLEVDKRGGVRVIVRYTVSLGRQGGGQGELQRATC